MTWQAAIDEACKLARTYPGQRFYVAGYRHAWRLATGSAWLYEARCAGPVAK